MKEGIIKDAYELIAKEVQLILSLSYLFMIAVGMLFNYKKYGAFGINIFEYADVFDFLIAPFADWSILIFTLGTVLFTFAVVVFDNWWKRKYPNSYSKGRKKNRFRIFDFGKFSK